MCLFISTPVYFVPTPKLHLDTITTKHLDA